MTKHYECSICLGVNHVKNTHCRYCGTTPAEYSIIGKPSILNQELQPIEVVSARGSEHVEHWHTRKVYLRTVPADYFASPAE